MADPTRFGFGDFRFCWGDHVCAIYEDRAQQMEVMVPFMAEGLQAGQRCVWVSPPSSADLFRRSLAEAGADLLTLEASGQLLVIPDTDYYMRDGVFVPDRTLDLARTLYEDSMREGYPGVRAAGDCSCAARGPVNPALWEKYELDFGEELAGKPAVVVCQYDRRRLPQAHIEVALRTHSTVIVGERVWQNPAFVGGQHLVAEETQVH